MPSLIPGYEYDIFISYRQKDNKYDGWVTEFVENLKKELESTFKEEISVYFDINPHDGLLETHDVDASLKDKLKCLIFVPVISRTYCDPKSFSWEHEFRAFVEMASNDQFGLKIRLPNGNVVHRVLPVRIHDIDIDDIKTFETILGGHLRSIDFIYKEAGINRQLRSKDDDLNRKTGQYLYRDQINKAALALKDCIYSIKKISRSGESLHDEDMSIDQHPEISAKKEAKPSARSLPRHKFRKLIYFSVSTVFLALIVLSALIVNHKMKVKWARGKALKEVREMALQQHYHDAFRLAVKAEKYIKGEKEFVEFSRFIRKVSIQTDPPGVEIHLRDYSDLNGKWEKIGITPIDSIKLPYRTYYIARFEKEGYENVTATISSFQKKISRTLLPAKNVPTGMVYVEGLYNLWQDYSFPDQKYFIDRYEVTNKQYKEFINKGGYTDRSFWKHKFIKDNKEITWEKAMKEFVDKTGRYGPSIWESGDYRDGEDDYPVSGVCWYEAAAYAEYSGKDLPTLDHWNSAAWSNVNSLNNFNSQIAPLSNFKGKGPEPVGSNQGINCFGAYDMAGNVREWCINESSNGRVICGGAYNNISYMYTQWSQLSPFDRSPENGFRCVLYTDRDSIPNVVFNKIKPTYDRDFYKEKPVSDEVFNIYRNQFLYDKSDLDSRVEYRDQSNADWIVEKITFNAAYPGERVIAYLFLPKNSAPPYQTMVFYPGTDAVNAKDIFKHSYTFDLIGFMLKSGRAVIYPVYKGTFERQAGLDPLMTEPNPTHEYTQWMISWVKDLKSSIDYAVTRNDLDTSRLGYYGYSWGGMLGGIIPAVETRLKLCVLYSGGFDLIAGNSLPEVDAINYVTRIKIPVLMLNGKYDSFFPLNTTVWPFLDLLGTPKSDKKLVVYETDHNVPQLEMVKETYDWLDKYFGPVNLK